MVIIFEPVKIQKPEEQGSQVGAALVYGKFSKNGVAPRDGENIKITFDGFK